MLHGAAEKAVREGTPEISLDAPGGLKKRKSLGKSLRYRVVAPRGLRVRKSSQAPQPMERMKVPLKEKSVSGSI